MSSRARRVTITATTSVTPWLETLSDAPAPAGGARRPAAALPPGSPAQAPAAGLSAAQEREIFANGFAQGERAGAAAAQEQSAVLAKELSRTLEDLMQVRAEMIRQTERQMVQLALAVARRVVRREVSLDQDLLLAMMRVALDRLSDAASVTVRLHPAEHKAVTAAMAGRPFDGHVTVVADARVARGGCRVESDYGEIDAGVDAQIQEIARTLLGDEEAVTA
jgi:flagellar assembly protein FliH